MRLADDPRWQRFNDASRVCSCCGKRHSGVFDLSYPAPFFWGHAVRQLVGTETIDVRDDILGTDFCRMGDDYAIRCILPLPIIGSEMSFSFGIWVSASRETAAIYSDSWRANDYSSFPGWAGWLCNPLPYFMVKKPVLGDAYTGKVGDRPRFFVRQDQHELGSLQRTGITFDQLLDIYAAAGQDLRPHLEVD